MARAWKPAAMRFEKWQKYSAEDDVRRRLIFHIMQHEMNVTNKVHHQPTKRGLDSRRETGKKRKKEREAEWGGAVTCGNTASDLTTTQRSKVFALHAELIAVWFSTDMRPHTNAVVTNLSICPLSHGRKQCEYYRNVEGYCNGSCQSFNTEPLQLLPTTQTLAELLRREGHFTVS